MRSFKYLPAFASLLLPVAAAAPALAQGQGPWVQLEATSVNLGLGSNTGDGLLHLPNLGTNCEYPFKVNGFGAGIHVGISKVSASGAVQNMTRVSDLTGQYQATQGETTLVVGGGSLAMRNKNNPIVMNLKAETQGIGLGFGGQGMTVQLAEPPLSQTHAYVLEFGYNKTWVNADSRAILDQVIRAWKCHYANIWMFGHTDTVGKEDENLALSQKRSDAVREYLAGAGINPARLMTKAQGENQQLVVTDQGVRLRNNRAVVIVIQLPQ